MNNNDEVSAGRSREARNLAEKHRRDKMSQCIGDLINLVPHAKDSCRRLDKTAVLRLATHGLRLQHVFGKSAKKSRKDLNMETMTRTLLNLIDGFVLTLNLQGQIVLVSETIEKYLGYRQCDLYGYNILQITHPDDLERFQEQLIPTDLDFFIKAMKRRKHKYSDCEMAPESPSSEKSADEDMEDEFMLVNEIDRRLRSDKRCFTVRLAKCVSRSRERIYEYVKIYGNFKRSDNSLPGTHLQSVQLKRAGKFVNEVQFKNNPRQNKLLTKAGLYGINGSDIVLVAIANIVPMNTIERCHMEAYSLQYRTRHLIDGRIVECDQRIGLVAGYLTEEVHFYTTIFFCFFLLHCFND